MWAIVQAILAHRNHVSNDFINKSLVLFLSVSYTKVLESYKMMNV